MTRRDDAPAPKAGARWFRLLPWNRARLEAEVREELEAHIALCVEYLVARGASRDDAEREARARFGDFDAARRRLYITARQREVRMDRRQSLDELRQDVALGLRLFRRNPLFFLATVLTLAVGVGANGAVFSVLRASLLTPLPYRNPDELVMVWPAAEHPKPLPAGVRRLSGRERIMAAPTVLGWRQAMAASVGDIAAVLSWNGNLEPQLDLSLQDRAERLRGALVTPNFFTLLGVRALHGRVFTPADEASGQPFIVLSHALWQRD